MAHEAADEIERLRAELELRRKSGSAVDRLHNLCEGIADDADGSEWSREEWERIDAENTRLRAENDALRNGLHRISLASQNSMSSLRECGQIARTALDEAAIRSKT
jgi:hypothetical protein